MGQNIPRGIHQHNSSNGGVNSGLAIRPMLSFSKQGSIQDTHGGGEKLTAYQRRQLEK